MPFMVLPVVIVFYLLSMALNRFGFVYAGRLTLVTSFNVVLFVCALAMGRDSGAHIFYLPTKVLPLLLFDLRHSGDTDTPENEPNASTTRPSPA